MDSFKRSEMLVGETGMRMLKSSHVAVFGLGGVGSWAAECLARAGVGMITIVDGDCIDVTNINRQLIALRSTIGKNKTDVMAQRIADINPDCEVNSITEFYRPDNRNLFFRRNYTYIIDAIDTVTSKLDLIETALSLRIPIISSLGTGNRLDCAGFAITDISKTSGCPLARVVRRELKKRGITRHIVLYSPEPPLNPNRRNSDNSPENSRTPGSVPWIPPVAGFMLAGEVCRRIISNGEPDQSDPI